MKHRLPLPVREMRAELPLLACLAVLVALLTAAVNATGPLLDRLEVRALDERLAAAQRTDTLVRVTGEFDQLSTATPPAAQFAAGEPTPLGEDLDWALAQAEPELVGGLHGSLTLTSTRVDLPSSTVRTPAGPAELSLLYADDAPAAGSYAQGRPPRATGRDRPVELAVSTRTAQRLHLRPGSRLRLDGGLSSLHAPALVTGVFRAPEPAAPGAGPRLWREQPLLACPLDVKGAPVHAQALIAPGSLEPLQHYGLPRFQAQWRLRLDLADAADRFAGDRGRAALVRALSEYGQLVRTHFCEDCSTLKPTGDTYTDQARPLVEDFGAQWHRAQQLTSFAVASLAGVGLAAVVVTARLAVRRRAPAHRLQRARGASATGLALARALQTAPAALLGLAAGLALSRALIPAGPSPAALATAAAAWLTLPVLTWRSLREGALRTPAETPVHRRATAEAAVLLLAAAGVLALRLRGPASADGADPQLAAVPLLCALAVVIVLVRLYPLPLHALARLTARRRGALGLIAAARAAKDAPAATLALLVLVTTLGSAVFGGLVTSTVEAGRATALTWSTGGADAVLTGATDPAAARALRRAPGVAHTARLRLVRTDLTSTRSGAARTSVYLLAPDAPQLTAAAPDSATAAALRAVPEADARGGLLVIPVLATAGTTDRQTGDTFETTLKGARVQVRVVGELPRRTLQDPPLGPLLRQAPAAGADGEAPVLLAPAASLDAAERAGAALRAESATLLYAAPGKALDPAAVRAAAPPTAPGSPYGALLFHAEEAQRTDGDGVLDVVRTVHGACTALAAAFALLALLLELLLSAPDRGRTASYLRTLGLAPRPATLLGLLQLAPMALAAALGGLTLGYALPAALGPALDLRALTGGPVQPPLHTDHARTLALGAGLLALIACAVAADQLAARRRGVGAVLRLGENR
ncbi:hypothetical protein ACFQLX_09195 [Streptomyces polyrhachis]|uniref:ABC transport system permease protein n=1 Tax=Streptomyces polyrhachis TaxID=1282885 RepID=A0ABW2GF29_9ACTN